MIFLDTNILLYSVSTAADEGTKREQAIALAAELDALWELRQAQADLAAAIGDPALTAKP